MRRRKRTWLDSTLACAAWAAAVGALLYALASLADGAETTPKAKLLFFHAEWCGACKQLDPLLARWIAAGVPVVSIDTDQYPELARRHNVTKLPTLVAVAEGRAVGRLVGVRGSDEVKRLIETCLWSRLRGAAPATYRQPRTVQPRVVQPRSPPPATTYQPQSQWAGKDDLRALAKRVADLETAVAGLARVSADAATGAQLADQRSYLEGLAGAIRADFERLLEGHATREEHDAALGSLRERLDGLAKKLAAGGVGEAAEEAKAWIGRRVVGAALAAVGVETEAIPAASLLLANFGLPGVALAGLVLGVKWWRRRKQSSDHAGAAGGAPGGGFSESTGD